MKNHILQRVIAGLLLLIGAIWFVDSYACENPEGHAYVGLGIGKAGTWLNPNPDIEDRWDDDGGNHALIKGGYRHPIYGNWLWVNGELGHHSTYNKKPPEPEVDYFVIGLEARWY